MKSLQPATAAAGAPAGVDSPTGFVREGVARGEPSGLLTFADVLGRPSPQAPLAAPRGGPVVPSAREGQVARQALAKNAHAAGASSLRCEDEERRARLARSRKEDDPLDPSARHAAQMAPVLTPAPSAPSEPDLAQVTSARGSLEMLLPQLVKRVAWSVGDGKRRAMRLEIAEGPLAGGTLLVQAEAGRVHVRLDAPSHLDTEGWRQRISERLARRGIAVDAIDIG